MPLGLEVPKERDYQVETFRFEYGDLLVLHTDGVVEAGMTSAPSIRSGNGSRSGGAAAHRRWWTISTPICSGTPAGSSTTTPPSW